MAKTNSLPTLLTSQSLAAAGTVRAAVDIRAIDGGKVTVKITNGATGPTLQCVCSILVAHNTGTTPATGAAGADWKTVAKFGGGVIANSVLEADYTFGPEVQHLEVEFTGNTGQAVTIEAAASAYAY